MTQVRLTTSVGDITLALNSEKAPTTVENFLQYVKDGHYDGTIFHRIIPAFMIQGGGLTENLSPKPTRATIENEARNGLRNTHYTVSMARTSDPHSASSQFFINTADNHFLNHTAANASGWGYAVFGTVIDGRDIVDKLADVSTGTRGGMQDVPLESVSIISATVVE